MTGYESFLQGIKPAFLATHMYEQKEIDHLKRLGYPYYFQDHEYGGSTIFFSDEAMRDRYISELNGIELHSREETIITGKVLGFPPKACEFFANAWGSELFDKKRAGFRYNGIEFAGNIDDTESICQWLWSNVPAPLAAVVVEYKNEVQLIEPSVVAT